MREDPFTINSIQLFSGDFHSFCAEKENFFFAGGEGKGKCWTNRLLCCIITYKTLCQGKGRIMQKPLVSVIIPVYNGEKYICKAVDSAFAQDVPVEVIVIDDGSRDDTPRLLKRYQGREGFRAVFRESNQGAARARNQGVGMAKGEYVAFLDADDWWEKGKLSVQIRAMEETGCVLCTTGRELMYPDGSSTGRYIPVHREITYKRLLRHNSINCSSVLIRRDVALEFPMEHDDSHEDYIAWLRILKKYHTAVGINRAYLKYRLSEGGKSRQKTKSAVMTYRAYRYAGIGRLQSIACFLSYAVNGLWKYR